MYRNAEWKLKKLMKYKTEQQRWRHDNLLRTSVRNSLVSVVRTQVHANITKM